MLPVFLKRAACRTTVCLSPAARAHMSTAHRCAKHLSAKRPIKRLKSPGEAGDAEGNKRTARGFLRVFVSIFQMADYFPLVSLWRQLEAGGSGGRLKVEVRGTPQKKRVSKCEPPRDTQ